MPEEPRCHESSVGPARDSDIGLVHEAPFLDLLNASHHVATWTVSCIAENSSLVFVAKIVATAIIWFEHEPALGGHELGQHRKGLVGCRRGTSMDEEDQRIVTTRKEIRRVC